MAANKKTSLSAGEIIVAMLLEDPDVSAITQKIFPVVSTEAILPYILYRRAELRQEPAKGKQGADTVGIEVICYTQGYTQGLELAEAVRAALDNKQASIPGLTMRSCVLDDSSEHWADDAYAQDLVFRVKI